MMMIRLERVETMTSLWLAAGLNDVGPVIFALHTNPHRCVGDDYCLLFANDNDLLLWNRNLTISKDVSETKFTDLWALD